MTSVYQHKYSHQIRAPFTLSALFSAVALSAVTQASMLHAAEASDPQAIISTQAEEIKRLRAENEALKRSQSPATAPEASVQAPAAIAATPPQQQDDDATTLGRVVVRGKKNLAIVRDVPQSISVISGEDLKLESAVTLDAITKRLANVKWNYGNSQTSNFSIRGLGKIGNSQAADPSVGVTVDNVPYAFNALTSFNFYDVDTAQVARGPQGTLSGKNAVLGSVAITNKRPSFTPGHELSLGFSKYGDQSYANSNGNLIATAVSTGPLIDDILAYRASLHVDKGGGFFYNKYNPDNQFVSTDRVSGRLQLLLVPSETFDARLQVEITPRMEEFFNGAVIRTPTPTSYSNGSVNTLSNDASTRFARRWFLQNQSYSYAEDYLSQDYLANDSQGPIVTGTNGVSLELNWALNENTQLKSISAFRDYYFNAFQDDDENVFDIMTATGTQLKYKQASQEFRLSSKFGELVDYQTGIYLLRTANNVNGNRVWGSDAGAWNASNSQYALLDQTAAGRSLLTNSLADLWLDNGLQTIRNESAAWFGQADWHVTDPLTITTGLRYSKESRRNTTSIYIRQNGYGSALNPAAVNDVPLGGFDSNATSGELSANNNASQLALAESVAQQYFNKTWAALSTDEKRQIAAAKAIRAQQIGVVWNPVRAEKFDDDLLGWVITPRYEINDNLTVYLSYAHGEKAGVPQVVNGRSQLVKKEKNDAYEAGLKTTLLGGDLLFNAAIFQNDIKNYQQSVRIVDQYSTDIARRANPLADTVYVSATGNVPKVRVKGVEIDTIYAGIKDWQLRFAGAYNDARYKSFPNSAQPPENGYSGSSPYQDVSGETLPGAAKVTFDVGIAYNTEVLGNKLFHATLNTSYTSRYNSDNALSSYGWIPSNSVTDFSIGIGQASGEWDINAYIKNLFDDDTHRAQTWNTYSLASPRLFGVAISSKF